MRPRFLLPGIFRRHLKDEVGCLRLFPELVDHAVVLGRAEHDEDIRRHGLVWIPLLVVDEQVGRHVDIRSIQVAKVQYTERVMDCLQLPVVFSQWQTVGTRI